MRRNRTYIAIPPGETIKEQLEIRKMKEIELACRMNMSTQEVRELISGNIPLTSHIAKSLEEIFGVPSKFWNNLETIYRDKLIKIEE